MPDIIFISATGSERRVAADPGVSVMEAAIRNDVDGIDAECGGACACATCHVYIDKAWLEKVGEAEGAEKDMLEFAGDVRSNSRLSCQITVREDLDGLVVVTPASQSGTL